MRKQGKDIVKGHRAELVIIQLFIVVCWLIPIALELIVRRFSPSSAVWQTIRLGGSFFLNRLLLAPAHTGYFACCRRLAAMQTPTAVTSEIEDLNEHMMAPTLLSCFFLDYRHPIKSLRWQLRYDALRFFVVCVFLFPALLFVAVGAKEPQPLLQAVCSGGGALCALSGSICAYIVLLRLRPMVYHRPQYGPFWQKIYQSLSISHGRITQLLRIRVKQMHFTPLFCLPFTCSRAIMLTQEAVLFVGRPKTAKKRRQRIFHTRVLRDA